MKKYSLITFSFLIAISIFMLLKMPKEKKLISKINEYQTFFKTPSREIASYKSTPEDLKKAQLLDSSKKSRESDTDFLKNIPQREGRLLIGDNINTYKNAFLKLEMINGHKKNWKEMLGSDLLRFHGPDTKLIVKEEYPIIKVFGDKGKYFEQVVVTYLHKNGDRGSFRALVNSETGLVEETWDRTIHEKAFKKKNNLGAVPLEQN